MGISIEIGGRQLWFGLISQYHRSRIDIRRCCNEQNAFTTLRKKRKRIHDAISPAIAAFFKCLNEGAHPATLVQLQHEGNVLKHDPRHASLVE